MEKIKRTLAICGITAAFCLGSCISMTDELDLNKDISLDMQIGPGGLTIPLGSLSRIYLDSLIKVDGDNSVLDTLDGGLFGFSMKDTLDEVSVTIDKVSIEINDTDVDPMETSFEEADIDDVEIEETDNPSTVKIEKIDLSDLKLPSFSSNTQTDNIEVNGSGSSKVTISDVKITDNMDCKFDYTFPSDLKKLDKIMFGDKGTVTGQKLSLNVDLSGVFATLSNPEITISSLTITFPEKFVVAKDDGINTYIKSGVSANNNVFKITSGEVKGVSAGNSTLPITFYLKEGDFSEYENKIEFDKKVVYNVELEFAGVPVSAGKKTFKVNTKMQEQLEMADIDAETKEKGVEVQKDTITSSCVVSGLDGVTRVELITFKPETSLLHLQFSELDLGDRFNIKSGNEDSYIELRFPAKYEFDQTYCRNENTDAGTWSGSTVKLDASKAIGHTVELKVKSLAVNDDVDMETASIEIVTDVEYDGYVKVNEADNVNLAALDKLCDKTLHVIVWGKFEVDPDNTEVISDEMKTDFDNTTEITIDEKVDDQLKIVQRIDLIEASAVDFSLDFDGVPSTIETLTFSRFTIEFPDFMKLIYTGADTKRVKAVENKLIINGDLTYEELHIKGFSVNGLKVETLKFKGKDGEIKDGRLNMKKDVCITGAVTVSNQKVTAGHSDITVYPTVRFAKMDVKSIYGKVEPKIDPIHESVELDMGDDMDFFKDENNNLSLKDPQITLNLVSSVTVPIDLDLKLSSKDSKGNYIKKNVTPDKGKIHLGKCDSLKANRKTTLVLSKVDKPQPASGDTMFVQMSQLSELMTTVPDVIEFELKATADQSVDHYVDLTRTLSVSGDYNVSIPLSFDSLYVEYNDTIKDLGEDLEDIGDMIDEANLQILADVVSTIPLGVKLSAKTYDKNGQEVPNIEIASCDIKPGSESGTESLMELGLKVKNGGLAKLDNIILTLALQSGDEAFSMRKGQWLDIKKIRIKFPEGLKIDLTESRNDDKKSGKK